MVIGKPYIRFYAGVPILNADGQRIGVFCIKDTKPRTFSKANEEILQNLSAWAQLEINSRNLSMALVEQRRMSESLKQRYEREEETEVRDAAILESIGDGLIMVDKRGTIVEMNRAAAQLIGTSPDEYMGKPYKDIFSIRDEKGKAIANGNRPLHVALSTGRSVSTTIATPIAYYYVRKDRTAFPVAMTVTPVVLNKRIIGAVEIFRDITKEKEIDRAKSEFISLASHQLRTPPTSMKWFLEMLRSGEVGTLNGKQDEYLDEVYRNNQRMIALVNTLLNVSRMELGVFAVTPEPTDIVTLVKDTLKDYARQIREKKLDVKEAHARKLPRMYVDPKLLSIVIQNVVSNSVKYTPEKGKIRVDVSLKKKGKELGRRKIKHDSLVIVVSDTGYGIPKSQQNKIFMKFFRADNVREKDTDGTGLGLYLSRAIVDHARGDVWFESELNRGTRFYIVIPSRGMKKQEGAKEIAPGSTY